VIEAIKMTKQYLTSDQTRSLVSACLDASKMRAGVRVLARQDAVRLAGEFDCGRSTVYRIWKVARANYNDPSVRTYKASPMRANQGRKLVYDREELASAIAEVPEDQKQTIRQLAKALGVSVRLLQDMMNYQAEDGNSLLRRCNTYLFPSLTEDNKLLRFYYACNEVKVTGFNQRNIRYHFNPQFNRVYVDEKWFYIAPQLRRCYLSYKEDRPKPRRIRNKRHMTKVQFLVAVARPRFADNGDCVFNGKIGVFPFVTEGVQQRTSNIRTRGDLVYRNVNVTSEVYQEYMFDKVLPAIMEKWPDDTADVEIQHDNATVHFKETDAVWNQYRDALKDVGFGIRPVIKEQPPNSPDSNILDLGFFNSLQSKQWQLPVAKTTEELIERVEEAWNEYDPRTLEKVFLTHQATMDEIIKCHGDNTFKAPHYSDGLSHGEKRPAQLELTHDAAEVYKKYLD